MAKGPSGAEKQSRIVQAFSGMDTPRRGDPCGRPPLLCQGDREGRPYAKREKIHGNEKPSGFGPEGLGGFSYMRDRGR